MIGMGRVIGFGENVQEENNLFVVAIIALLLLLLLLLLRIVLTINRHSRIYYYIATS